MKTLTVDVKAEWPEENKRKLMEDVNALNEAIEKASALADALAEKMKEIEINVTCS